MDQTKKCYKCEQDRLLTEFYACKKSPDGYRTFCKKCIKADSDKSREPKIKKDPILPKLNLKSKVSNGFKKCTACSELKSVLEFHKQTLNKAGGGLHNECKECTKKIRSRPRYKEKRLKIIKDVREWQNNNRDKVNKIGNSGQGKLRRKCRRKIKAYLNYNSDRKIHKFIGCTSNELKRHLSAQFIEDMSWDNYGEIWNIDHIIPLCKFDLTIEQNMLNANHWTNLRPAWKKDNCYLTEEQKLIHQQ